MSKKLYTLEEAQIIWTKIINNRADELMKELNNSRKSKLQKLAYV